MDFNYNNHEDSFLLSVEKHSGYVEMPQNHSHDAYEIYYLFSGKRNYFINNRTYLVNKGDLVLIDMYDLHKTLDAGAPSYERFLINFKSDFFMPVQQSKLDNLLYFFKKNISVISFSIKDQEFIENLLLKMKYEAENKGSCFEEMIQSILVQLLVFSTRYIDSNPNPFYREPNPLHEKVSFIVQYINENFIEPLTLFSIAEHFYISPYYFCKVFKEYTGFTFIEYLNNLRVKEASKLLRESRLNIVAISEKTGFGSISHFGRVFKEISGFSPLNYRKMNKWAHLATKNSIMKIHFNKGL